MGFLDKIKSAFRKIRTKLIVYTILVAIVIVWLVAPLNTSIVDAQNMAGVKFSQNPMDGDLWGTLLTRLAQGIVSPLTEFGKCFNEVYFAGFWTMLKVTFGIYLFFATIGIVKAFPRHEYENIENGSSDWSENGEQYKVLSKNKGIVLAEKNYLPVDKRGNVNVLVVRRFWCW